MNLKMLFKETDWTEQSMAQRTGVHQSTISRHTKGSYPTPLGRAMQIEKVTDGLVQVRDLILSKDAKIALKMLKAQGC